VCDTTASLQFEKTSRHDAVLVVSAIAVQGAGKTFVAGADIATLELLPRTRRRSTSTSST
jgi:enoyl-CoA hydratase/carnithine racemase